MQAMVEGGRSQGEARDCALDTLMCKTTVFSPRLLVEQGGFVAGGCPQTGVRSACVSAAT